MKHLPDAMHAMHAVQAATRPLAKATPGREELSAVVEQYRADLKTMFPLPPARSPRRKQAVAAVVLLGTGMWWLDPAYRTEEFTTEIGQIVDVQLADGSRVTLDTDTHLSMQWHLRSRRVTLSGGRAHFDVAHSTLRPFTVDAGPAQVRVVGTRFDVWRQGAATQVWVYQGKVAVWRSGETPDDGVLLTPKQQSTVSTSSDTHAAPLEVQPLADADEADRQAWRQGRLVFNDTPLDQVVATLQRYRRLPVTLSDRKLAALTLSGVFETANTDQLLAMLPGTLPVSLRRMADGGTEIRPR